MGACRNGLTSPIIFKPGETLSHENYIDVVLPHARSEGKRLLGDDFIYQQDNARPHVHRMSLAWCEENLPHFISSKRWPANSPDLNMLDYHVWDAVANQMQWQNIHDYDSLIDEIERAILRVPLDGLIHSVDNWSHRILTVLKTDGEFIK